MRQGREGGFTLVELMVVVFIIGLLATLVLVNVAGGTDRARIAKARTDVAALESALELYRLQMRGYPSMSQGLEALIAAPSDLERAERYPNQGFIRRLPRDPWDNAYVYVYPGERGGVDVFSYGADGRPGGEGADADIGNWSP